MALLQCRKRFSSHYDWYKPDQMWRSGVLLALLDSRCVKPNYFFDLLLLITYLLFGILEF